MKYEDIEELSKNAKIPCVNLLCNKNHPTQAICDLMTIKEKFGKINGIKVAFVGACNNNVARSLIEGLLMLGGSYIGIGPKKIWPSNNELIEYKKIANENNGSIEFVEDVNKLKNVDVIYQDVFLDLGESEDL
jgi:ornithine carbamoyltransferase